MKFLNFSIFLSPKIVLTSASSANPDEMPPYVAFHLALHCLPKYLLTDILNEEG